MNANSAGNSNVKKIGFWMVLSLVLGNMIGSGIFVTPSTLAPYGLASIYGWIFTTFGAIMLALLFSNLSRHMPATGGPYAYCRYGLGDAIGFLVAWGYWVATTVGNAAIVVAAVGYIAYFFPDMVNHTHYVVISYLAIIWFFTFINCYSVYSGGLVQLVTTICKLIPLVALPIFGVFYIEPSKVASFNPSGEPWYQVLLVTGSITFWSFLGLESATVPAGSIENPKRNIPLATILGTVLAAVIYITCTVVIICLVDKNQLAISSAPFADAAAIVWGEYGGALVALGAILSCFGALNGWILLQGQVPLAAAEDKLFPKVFAKKNKRGTPALAITISSIVMTIFVLLNASKSLVSLFHFIILLATLTTVIPYSLSSISQLIIVVKDKKQMNKKTIISNVIIAIVSYVFTFFAIAGAGMEVAYWSGLLLLLGLPLYAWIKYEYRDELEK